MGTGTIGERTGSRTGSRLEFGALLVLEDVAGVCVLVHLHSDFLGFGSAFLLDLALNGLLDACTLQYVLDRHQRPQVVRQVRKALHLLLIGDEEPDEGIVNAGTVRLELSSTEYVHGAVFTDDVLIHVIP